MFIYVVLWALLVMLIPFQTVRAGVGDPQLRTDHSWYPGELACSTWEQLRQTQAAMFARVTGRQPQSEEDRVLAAWMWRNIHFAHGEEGKENLWGRGFQSGDTTTREYWTGLFAHGFGLCGTTHAQWTVELNSLLGSNRSRTAGVAGHNACEVFLQGGPYGTGQWALLDHDLSTVVFDPAGARLLSINEIRHDLSRLTDPQFNPQRQHGWPLGGLHRDDPQAYSQFRVAEYYPGYAGPPPMVHLRRGETLRRYFHPGLEDGKTFVFWGRNYRTGGIPGPERSRTWVNQPERFSGTPEGSGFHPGQARYGNAVFTYKPDFRGEDYREGVISEDERQVVFEFQSPFIIAAAPQDDSDWGIYRPGCREGLVIRGRVPVAVSVSVDGGATWQSGGMLPDRIDLTDFVKGYRQYWLRVEKPASELVDSELEVMTVCQANPALFPRLKEGGSQVTFAASQQAITSAGPTLPHVQGHVIDGAFGTSRVTLELSAPRSRPVHRVYAAAHVASSNPPDPAIRYQIEVSTNRGQTWESVVQDWRIDPPGEQPTDFWSQSFCFGDRQLPAETEGPVRVRFSNNGGKKYLRAEAHLMYAAGSADSCNVTWYWSDDQSSDRTFRQTFSSTSPQTADIPTGRNVRMRWVEFSCVSARDTNPQ